MKVFLPSDRFEVSADGITLVVSPLTHAQRLVISSFAKTVEGVATPTRESYKETLRQAVKGFSGFVDYNDEPLQFKSDDQGIMTEELAESLVDMLMGTQVGAAALLVSARKMDVVKKNLENVEIKLEKKSQAS